MLAARVANRRGSEGSLEGTGFPRGYPVHPEWLAFPLGTLNLTSSDFKGLSCRFRALAPPAAKLISGLFKRKEHHK